MKYLRIIPWAGILLLLTAGFHLSGMNTSLGSIPSIIILVTGMIILILEFIRSGDIRFEKFVWDLTMSVLTLIFATGYYTRMFLSDHPLYFIDYYSYAIIVIDAWLSPVNAFRTALRNLQIGNQPEH